jgi:hypothetical protein
MSPDGTTVAFRNALDIINYMFANSREVKAEYLLEYGFPVENPNELIQLFIGNVRGNGISKEIGLSSSAVNDASVLLNTMRCFTSLKRGGPSSKSVYLLHYKPTVEQFNAFREGQGSTNSRIAPNKWQQTLQELADLRIRVSNLEAAIKIVSAELDGHSHSGHDIR